MDVTEWLRGLGPEQYAPAFHDNNINAKILSSLTGEDLRELGVISVGHARRVLDAVAGIPGGTDSQLAADFHASYRFRGGTADVVGASPVFGLASAGNIP